MAHDSRLMHELRLLLHTQRVAALGTLAQHGTPMVSMVPYAIDAASACLVIHVSGLAAHTRNMQSTAAVSLMVMQPEVSGQPVHALARVTIEGQAEVLNTATSGLQSLRAAYLLRFPEAEPMTQLGDFMFVAIHPIRARQVAGFGAARTVDLQELANVLAMN